MSADQTTQGQEQGEAKLKKRKHCGAKTRKGTKCKLPGGHGTSHVGYGCCRRHGGSTPNHVKAAQGEIAHDAVVTFGLPIEVEPQVALLQEVHRCAGHVEWLRAIVEALPKEQLTAGISKTTKKGAEVTTTATASVNVWVRLYQDERDRLVRVCKTAIDAGVAEAQVRLAEGQAQLLADVVRVIVTQLGHDPQDDKTRRAVRHGFELIQGGKAA